MAKDKIIDISKTGPQGYRQLQQANDDPFIGVRPQPRSMFDIKANAPQQVKSPLADTNTPFGESMFDPESVNINDFYNLEDVRANNQPWYSKVSAGLAKGAVLAGTTFLDGTIGLAVGLGTAIKDWRLSGLWDNDFSRAMNELNKASEELLPNYYTKAEQEEPWYKNIFTANFLGDKFLKNIGFTIGAFYSGNVYSSALSAAKLPQFIGAVTKSVNAPKMVTSGVGAALSAINEGRVEALNGAEEFEEKYKPLLDEQFRSRINTITQEYEANKGKSLVSVSSDGSRYMDPAYIKYMEDIEREKKNYESAMVKLQEDKAKVGNTILGLNTVILTASNIYQFGKLYARGFNTAKRLANITGDIGKYQAANSSKAATVLKIAGGAIAEGGEEISQSTAKNIQHHYYANDVNNYYRSLTDPNASKETLDWTKSFAEGMLSTLGEGSSWEEFFIGFLTGALGMPKFRSIRNEQGSLQSPVILEENPLSKWRELRKQADRNQEIANYMNNRVNSPEFKNYYQGLIRHNKYQNDMNDAALRDDEFDYKNAEHAQLVSDISMFSNAGKLEDLKTLINSSFDISDENIQSIIDNTTSTINKNSKEVKVSPFMDKDGNQMSKEEIVSELTNQRDVMMSTIDSYSKIRKDLDAKTGQVFTDDQLDELTWMKSQLENWSNRASEMSDIVRNSINNVISRLEGQKNAVEAIRVYEGQKNAELSENYNRADRIIRSINNSINNLDFIRNLDNENMALTLADNPDIIKGLSIQVNKLKDSILSASDKKDVLKKLNDLYRLGKASQLFTDKFNTYLTNPSRLTEDNLKTVEENIEEENKINKSEEISKLNNTINFQEVKTLLDNGTVSIENLDTSTSEASKNYKKASLFKNKALELINNSNSSNKEYLIDMLNRRFNESATYSDLANESLITDLSPEATILDSKQQETIENEFANILKSSKEKIDSGDSQKKDVKAEKTGILKPENSGKDDVPQPPTRKEFDTTPIINNIDKLDIPPEIKTESKAIISSINKNIESFEKDNNVKTLRKIQREVNSLSSLVGNEYISPIVDKVKELSVTDVLNPGNPNDILDEYESEQREYKPTEVTGVLKSVIPQFDLDAKRDGVLINFVHGETNKDYSYVYNKLNTPDASTGKTAFDYVNEGNIKEEDELEVRYEEATDEHPELLALYHNGVLVNYMNTNEAIDGVKEIKDKAKKGEKTTVTVTKIMNGKIAYDRNNSQSIGDLLGVDDAVIGVMKNRSMSANTDKFIEPVFDEAHSDGKVYILIPNSKGTLTPKRIYIRHLNKTEYDLNNQDNPVANDIRNVFRRLSELSNINKGYDEALDDIYLDLIDLLYIPDSFHINIIQKANEVSLQIAFNDRNGKRQNRDILLRRFERKSLLSIGIGANQDSEEYKASPEEIYPQIIDTFYEANLAFNVSAKKLTKKNAQEYANRLKDSNILSTYLTSKRMQGSWFLLNEKPNITHSNSSFEKAKASQQAKGGTRVEFNNNEYFVRNGIIFDQTGSIVDLGNNAQEVKDLAYIFSAYGNSYFGVNQHNGKVLLVDKNGKRGYDRNTNKYLSDKEVTELESILEGRKNKASKSSLAVNSLQESQKLVLRDDKGNPDTSNGSYMIMEDDGEYHEYMRVHTFIGSNYIGPEKKDGSATKVGTSIDEVSRQFFIDPTNVKKPNDMSDEAFGALIRGLGKFRDDANRRGLVLITDRTVVFHKYSDEKRIAGELDMFAYNPSTGEISIFDFKTSKYSTKDTAFSKVTRPNMFIRSNKEQYTLQLSAYARIFEDSFNIPVTNLVIVPFQVRYKDGNIVRVSPEAYVPLSYNSSVFQRADNKSVNENKTIKGQYVTMKDGNPEYHKADMQEIFTTGKGNTFYLAKVNDQYKLILPNGRSMTIDNALISDETDRTKANIVDFINSDNVIAAIQQALSTNPLEGSPYGNNIEVADNDTNISKDDTKTELNATKEQLAAHSIFESMLNPDGEHDTKQEEASKAREQDKKVSDENSSGVDNKYLGRKSWNQMSSEEHTFILAFFEGMTEKEVQEYWDGADVEFRESFILSCK